MTHSADVVPLHGPRRPSAPAGVAVNPAMLRRTARLIVVTHTDKALEGLFSQADDALFDRMSGNQGMDDLRSLRKNRALLLRRHREHLDTVWNGWDGGLLHPADVEGSDAVQDADTLALMADDTLERQIACRQLAQTLHRHHKEVLVALQGALMVLSRQSELPPLESAPWGPDHLAVAFREALAAADLSTQGELVLYKLYERHLAEALRKAYHELAQVFMRQGLPVGGIRPRVPVIQRSPQAPSGPPVASSRAESSSQAWNPGTVPEEAVPNWSEMGSQGSMEGGSGQGPAGWGNDMQELLGLLERLRSTRRVMGQSARPGPGGDTDSGGLLHAGEGIDRPVLNTHQTMEVLSWVQHHAEEHAPQQLRLLQEGVSLATQVKQLIARQAERMGVATGASISPSEEDAIDLVGMLFEVLLSERQVAALAQETMVKMVVPYIRVAVMDKRLFMQKTHPARRLLNTITEACQGNMGETPVEREVLDKVGSTVHQLTHHFNEDVAVFETLEQDFRTFFQQTHRRVGVAERRAAEQQRGQERLAEARVEARRMVQELMDRHAASLPELPPVLDAFIQQYWYHHLTVCQLRQGTDSPAVQNALALGENLMQAFEQARHGQAMATGVLEPVDDVLTSSGLVGQPAKDMRLAMAQALHSLRYGQRDTTPAPTVHNWASAALESAARASDATPAPSESPAPAAEAVPIDASALEQVKQLAVGQWLEIVDQDQRQPVKLSWISPISNKYLLVNRKGLRVCAETPEELAQRLTQGTLTIWQGEHPFEQALNQVMGRLKKQAEPNPAAS